jgi:hypothetical protein
LEYLGPLALATLNLKLSFTLVKAQGSGVYHLSAILVFLSSWKYYFPPFSKIALELNSGLRLTMQALLKLEPCYQPVVTVQSVIIDANNYKAKDRYDHRCNYCEEKNSGHDNCN